MSILQNAALKAALYGALNQAGANVYTILRTHVDANGQPNGAAAQAGTIYGVAYSQSSSKGALTIDLPGVLLSTQPTHALNGLLRTGDAPRGRRPDHPRSKSARCFMHRDGRDIGTSYPWRKPL